MISGHQNKVIIVTGTAGFIGFHVAKHLLDAGVHVVGIDSVTPYYDVGLKRARSAVLEQSGAFTFHEFDLNDLSRLITLMEEASPAFVVHLAAQAGVRHSIDHPRAYIDANVVGTFNLLEACRAYPPRHLMIASTSSVYGSSTVVPFSEDADTSRPSSVYAATKKATEVIAYSYASLFKLPITVFRFFTVYGPWGRPDMALFKFTAAILEDREIELFGEGNMSRDFTYIDDLVGAIIALVEKPPSPDDAPEGTDSAAAVPFRAVNIGSSRPVALEEFVSAVESALGRKASRKYLPMQLGDIRYTYADTTRLSSILGHQFVTPVEVGVQAFVKWYKTYHQID